MNPHATRLHVLFDIDGTLTDDGAGPQIAPDYVLGNAVFEVLLAALVARGRTRAAATEALKTYAVQNIFWDYADFIQHFRLPPQATWRDLRAWHARHLRVYADGVQLVRRLHARGYPLHIVSNNPLGGCLLKLEVAGLGSLRGTPWFSRIFCSNIQRGQKGDPAFWERAVISAGLAPEQVIVIGNDPHEDYEIPSGIGIRTGFIADRDGRQSRRPAGAVFVRSLIEVEAHLDHAPLSGRQGAS